MSTTEPWDAPLALTGGLVVGHDGSPGRALAAAAAGADLLVVGHRGRSHLADLLLGSVAEHVLRHARTSVVVVRP